MGLRTSFTAALCGAAFLSPNCANAQSTNELDSQSAKTFLESAYAHYQNAGKGIDFTGPNAGSYYHSSLIALIHSDIMANGPENVPAIDADPICGCRDWDGIWDLKIDVMLETSQRATAKVSFFVFRRRKK
jgi:hypothetical protein